jgi:phosphatidylethanolamine/phosphatidyl-N-methylethanolamine N-methyltransferase
MTPDPDHAEYLTKWSQVYERLNYQQGVAGYFLKKSHEWAEKAFTTTHKFSRVLEVGAGTGLHLGFVRHSFDEYWVTDINPPMLDKFSHANEGKKGGGKILVKREDASKLSFESESFDRLVAAHVLEHLPTPHDVLREWNRVLKPGGVMSLVLPCDPGLAWRLGRYTGPRRKFTAAGIDYDYWMAREHINPINNLVSLIRYYFDSIDEQWLPFFVPSMDLNLFYVAHITV